ncbi:hypothetical protein BDD12DRAFT_901984 [Trichophaea hybrida]|nr:hypothetical protein BDD12DRAFT_901984 [Trichophaea hybrida]
MDYANETSQDYDILESAMQHLDKTKTPAYIWDMDNYRNPYERFGLTPGKSVETLGWRPASVGFGINDGKYCVSASHLKMFALPKLKHITGFKCYGSYEGPLGIIPAMWECNLTSVEFIDSAIDGSYFEFLFDLFGKNLVRFRVSTIFEGNLEELVKAKVDGQFQFLEELNVVNWDRQDYEVELGEEFSKLCKQGFGDTNYTIIGVVALAFMILGRSIEGVNVDFLLTEDILKAAEGLERDGFLVSMEQRKLKATKSIGGISYHVDTRVNDPCNIKTEIIKVGSDKAKVARLPILLTTKVRSYTRGKVSLEGAERSQ